MNAVQVQFQLPGTPRTHTRYCSSAVTHNGRDLLARLFGPWLRLPQCHRRFSGRLAGRSACLSSEVWDLNPPRSEGQVLGVTAFSTLISVCVCLGCQVCATSALIKTTWKMFDKAKSPIVIAEGFVFRTRRKHLILDQPDSFATSGATLWQAAAVHPSLT